MHQQHALKEKRKLESKYDQMTCAIHEQSLTFQFIANQAWFLGDFLDTSIGKLNDKEHWDMPIEPQDEGVLLEGIDLGTGEDQPHDVTTGSQNHDTFEFSFHIDHTYSPAPEPGLSHVSHYHEVFNVTPQSECESEKEIEQDEGTYENEDMYVWFQPDTVPESEDADEDNEIHAACFEDLMVTWGEEVYQLDIQQKLDDLGSSVLSVVARDNTVTPKTGSHLAIFCL